MSREHLPAFRSAPFLVSAALLAGLLSFGLTVWRYGDSPLRFDETDFAAQAQGILLHGVPKVSFEEDKILHLKGHYWGYDARYGMWHPPVYVYTLAAAAALGTGPRAPWRAVSLAWFMGSLWLGWLIVRKIQGVSRAGKTFGWAVALLLLCPLLLQGSLYVDIDNTSLNFSILLLLLLFLRAPDPPGRRWTLGLAAAFAFSLWSKLTTPWLFLAAVALYGAARKRFWPGLRQTAAVALLGSIFFFGTYLFYCRLLSYPADFMMRFTYLPRTSQALHAAGWQVVLQTVRWYFLWISPGLSLLLAAALLGRARALARKAQAEPFDLLLIFSALGILVYGLGWIWGKYAMPAMFAGSLGMACWLERALGEKLVLSKSAFLSGFVFVVLAHLLWISPLQNRPAVFDLLHANLRTCLTEPRNLPVFWSLAVLAALWLFLRWRRAHPSGILALLIYLAAAHPILVAKDAFSPDDRSPFRPLHEQGFQETVRFLNQTLSSQDVLLCPKDMGFYFKGRYIPTDHVWVVDLSRDLEKILRVPSLRYLVDSTAYPTIPKNLFERYADSFVLLRTLRGFRVYAIRHPSA